MGIENCHQLPANLPECSFGRMLSRQQPQRQQARSYLFQRTVADAKPNEKRTQLRSHGRDASSPYGTAGSYWENGKFSARSTSLRAGQHRIESSHANGHFCHCSVPRSVETSISGTDQMSFALPLVCCVCFHFKLNHTHTQHPQIWKTNGESEVPPPQR